MGHDTGIGGYNDVLISPFCLEKCLRCWEEVGVVPCPQAFVQEPKVCHELCKASSDDKLQVTITEVQQANDISYDLLQFSSCDGSFCILNLKEE